MTAWGYEFYLRVLVEVSLLIILPRVLRGCFRGNKIGCKATGMSTRVKSASLADCLFPSSWNFRNRKSSKD